MKSTLRKLWMQLHAYVSVFFLPAAVLYAITGGLYLLGYEGAVKNEYNYVLDLDNGWPEDKDIARKIVLAEMARLNHKGSLPNDYYFWEGKHDWYGFKREVRLIPEDNGEITLKILEHDLGHQLLLIHKGFAGSFLKIMSLCWGISLLFSQLSGVILALNMPILKRNSIVLMCCGLAVLVVPFFTA